MNKRCIAAILLVIACSIVKAQPVSLHESEPFRLEIREGFACDLKSNLFLDNYPGEKLCQVTNQFSINAKTSQSFSINIAPGPHSIAFVDRGYMVPHVTPSLYFINPGPFVAARKISVCVQYPGLAINTSTTMRAAMELIDLPSVQSCTATQASSFISFVRAKSSPAEWKNLAIGPQVVDGRAVATPYLVQFRILID